jgi:hypothetical protein
METITSRAFVLPALLIVAAFSLGLFMPWTPMGMMHYGNGEEMSMEHMDGHRDSLLAYRDSMVDEMRSDGQYRCCLEQSCAYCIEKTPGHGEGPTCDCLADIVNGEHPCGECIGEILEGHGNPYLAKYFAKAISDEVGERHIGTLREIVAEKYNLSVNEQL